MDADILTHTMKFHLKRSGKYTEAECRRRAAWHMELASRYTGEANLIASGKAEPRRGIDRTSDRHGSKSELSSRNKEIITRRRKGQTLRQIGDRYGLSYERVRQIVAAHDRRTGENISALWGY